MTAHDHCTPPQRFVDYFVHLRASSAAEGTIVGETERSEDVQVCVDVASTYPSTEHKDCPKPEGLVQYTFPNGAHLSSCSTHPKYHEFVSTTASGRQLYGFCIVYDEALPLQELLLLLGEVPSWAVSSAQAGRSSA